MDVRVVREPPECAGRDAEAKRTCGGGPSPTDGYWRAVHEEDTWR